MKNSDFWSEVVPKSSGGIYVQQLRAAFLTSQNWPWRPNPFLDATWSAFCLTLASLLPPLGSFWLPVAAFYPPFNSLCLPFGSLCLTFAVLWRPFALLDSFFSILSLSFGGLWLILTSILMIKVAFFQFCSFFFFYNRFAEHPQNIEGNSTENYFPLALSPSLSLLHIS